MFSSFQPSSHFTIIAGRSTVCGADRKDGLGFARPLRRCHLAASGDWGAAAISERPPVPDDACAFACARRRAKSPRSNARIGWFAGNVPSHPGNAAMTGSISVSPDVR